jgi:hypothetical protein
MEMDVVELTESQFIIKYKDDLKQEVVEARELLGGDAADFLTAWIQQNSLVAAVRAKSDGRIPAATKNTYRDLSTADVSSPSRGGGSGEELTAVEFVAHAFNARERLCAKHGKDIYIQVVAETASSPLFFFSKAGNSSDYSELSGHEDIQHLVLSIHAAQNIL